MKIRFEMEDRVLRKGPTHFNSEAAQLTRPSKGSHGVLRAIFND